MQDVRTAFDPRAFRVVDWKLADGFLLSQFMTSSSNKRQDEFGGSAENRVELILRIIRTIRAEVPSSFCVGVKINTADFSDATAFSDMLRQIEVIQQEQIDYVHLSGGSFEDPKASRGEKISATYPETGY